MHVWMLFLEGLCNQSLGCSALVIREDTHLPLPVSCPADSLPKLTRQHRVVVDLGYRLLLLLLLSASDGPAPPVGPSALASPTRPAWRPWISRALQKHSVFVRMTWEKTRGLLEFQLWSITPFHSMARMTVKRRPTAPVGVAYQLADWASSRRQQRCHIASSATPPFRCDPSLWWGKTP